MPREIVRLTNEEMLALQDLKSREKQLPHYGLGSFHSTQHQSTGRPLENELAVTELIIPE